MEMKIIDPESDLGIVCTGVLFVVTSKVLSLASPVLSEMLQSRSTGRSQIKAEHNEKPTLNLPSDDPDASASSVPLHTTKPSPRCPHQTLTVSGNLPFFAANIKDNLQILPRSIIDALDLQLAIARRKIHRAIMEVPDKFSEFECKKANAFLADYVRALKEVGLLPGLETFMDKSPAEVSASSEIVTAGHLH
ncbi:hypothetical protein BJX70DRAFT_393429 [Aspergillus crustosus]